MSLIEHNHLRVYPANDGDSFLLNFNGIIFLIDGGYVNTYKNFIKNDLIELNKKGIALDYLIITHIDQDHISGINKFLEENNNSKIIKIDNVWHNSLKHLNPIRSKSEADANAIIENLADQSYLKELI
jgi:flavorubredoxin